MPIPIANIYYLLCYAWKRLEESELVAVDTTDAETLLDLFARVLFSGMTHLLKRGLDRGYVAYSESMACVRGKIDFKTTLERNLLRQARLHCEFDELSHNVLHNQIIKSTVRGLLINPHLEREQHENLMLLYRQLHDIQTIALSVTVFARVQLNRNNAFYGFLLDVCKMIYTNILAKEGDGDYLFRDFLRDEKQMGKLFEEFVRNFYRHELGKGKEDRPSVSSEAIRWDADPADDQSKKHLPGMQTDVSINWPNRHVIIDTKFYKNALQTHYDKESIHSKHLYQLFAYVKNLEHREGAYRNCEGMLLYPTVNQELNLSYMIQGHRISIRTVDLAQDWRSISHRLLSIVRN